MKRNFTFALLLMGLMASCGQQPSADADRLSNDEYDRLYMAEKDFVFYDMDKDGIITTADAELIDNIWFHQYCLDIVEEAGKDVPKAEYIQNYKTPVSTIDAVLHQNIEYKEVNGRRMMMDIYVPRGYDDQKVPVVAFCHGGGWTSGDKYLVLNGGHNQTLNSILERGIAVAAVNYRLTDMKETFVGDCAMDCLDALAFLNRDGAKYGLDNQRMAVWGGSAGGHLAQLVAFCEQGDIPGDEALAPYRVQPKCAVVWYGPCKISVPDRESVEADSSRSLKFTASTDYDEFVRRALEVSPVEYVDSEDPCALIMCGDLDFPEKAYMLGETMDNVGVPNEVFIVQDAGHSWEGDNIKPDRDGIGVITADYILKNVQ